MALSQCWEDSPLRPGLKRVGTDDLKEVYNERHRLALEELLSGGVQHFLNFLSREKIPNFLSDDEIQRIRSGALLPRCVSVPGEEQPLEQSISSSMDCSSVTYFPEVSDLEPPLLEMGWPAFTTGSYRGVTRAVAHFQPGYGDNIYSCKEAARKMIHSAKEVIAIVTDSLTDVDIFKDLQEACSQHGVPVYILLDQLCAPAFLKMCRNVGVGLDDLRQMRVRTITGATYYMRSGARITGKVHERFMLIDGNRVATGTYRFTWTDGKLNSSNLIELSGQITEKFDEEFRILYAQSLPINTQSLRTSVTYEHLTKPSVTCSPHMVRVRPVEPVCLTSTPNQKRPTWDSPAALKTSKVSNSSTIGEDWTEQHRMQILKDQPPEEEAVVCHASTQTSRVVSDSDTQTDLQLTQRPDQASSPSSASPTNISPAQAAADDSLKDCIHKLAKEHRHHYSTIRSKLEHVVTSLSQRRELVDVTNLTHHRLGGGGGARPQATC